MSQTISHTACVGFAHMMFLFSVMRRPNMALKSIFGILERKTLGGFRLPRFFMPEVMCALCTMNLNVSMTAEIRIR